MMRTLFVAAVAASSLAACTTETERAFESEPFTVDYRPDWQLGSCPGFNRSYENDLVVVIEGETVTFDGVPATHVVIGEPDEFGHADIAFTVERNFELSNDDLVPVSIDFSGRAGFDILSMDGAVKWAQPAHPVLADCKLVVYLSGWFVEAPEWRQ
ncbi:MAG TPA: hypothetical protein VM513_26850 [Kofleriaceae bacterium]|nr:hypothetical protein [Kofleriaceae bacterium]